MRPLVILGFLIASLQAATDNGSEIWSELKAKRDKLPGIHQEFEVSRTFKMMDKTQSSTSQIVLDMAPGEWRERSISGSGARLKIFDGSAVITMEEGGEEYLQATHKSKDPEPLPSPYLSNEADWAKVADVKRIPCKLSGIERECVVLEVPLKGWNRGTSTNLNRMLKGAAKILLDSDTGLALSLQTVELIERGNSTYQSTVSYSLKRQDYGKPPEASMFKIPDGVRQVKELSRWSASKIRKELAGKPAPNFTVTDIQGNSVALSDLKGKIVLLDFWTTWCPPCRRDAPSLDKLYRKYKDNELVIIGISVSEYRWVVERFLKDNPHEFSIVLTTENELPGAYLVSAFPTYIVIGKDGTLASAAEGDQGFSELRKLLKKAGLELE